MHTSITRHSAYPEKLSEPPFTIPYITLTELNALLERVGLRDNALVKAALEQAQASHGEQRRDDGGPYLEQHIYPVTVSAIEHELAVGHRVSAKLVATCLTHDVPEDDLAMPLPRFRDRFGQSSTHTLKPGRSVADLVDPLTKRDPSEFPGNTEAEQRAARDSQYEAGLEHAEYESQITKLADRYMNVLSLHRCSPDKIVRKIQETKEHYLPLAARVSSRYFEAISTRLNELTGWLAQNGVAVPEH